MSTRALATIATHTPPRHHVYLSPTPLSTSEQPQTRYLDQNSPRVLFHPDGHSAILSNRMLLPLPVLCRVELAAAMLGSIRHEQRHVITYSRMGTQYPNVKRCKGYHVASGLAFQDFHRLEMLVQASCLPHRVPGHRNLIISRSVMTAAYTHLLPEGSLHAMSTHEHPRAHRRTLGHIRGSPEPLQVVCPQSANVHVPTDIARAEMPSRTPAYKVRMVGYPTVSSSRASFTLASSSTLRIMQFFKSISAVLMFALAHQVYASPLAPTCNPKVECCKRGESSGNVLLVRC